MFPFTKKAPATLPPPTDQHQRLNERLDQTDSRLAEALKEMRRRLEQREQRLVVVK